MGDDWETPGVAKDGSIEGEGVQPRKGDDSRWQRLNSHIRYSFETFWIRQRSNAWTLIQLAGFAAFAFGAFRLFGIGIFGMDGLGPIPLSAFTTVYLPGPWSSLDTVWTLAWIWMGIGTAIVGLSTRKRRP
jgi:hypothetical protein